MTCIVVCDVMKTNEYYVIQVLGTQATYKVL